MGTIAREKTHNFADNDRPAVYFRCSPQLLYELRHFRGEVGVPIKAIVINALLCVYPHLSALCDKEKTLCDRYFGDDTEPPVELPAGAFKHTKIREQERAKTVPENARPAPSAAEPQAAPQ